MEIPVGTAPHRVRPRGAVHVPVPARRRGENGLIDTGLARTPEEVIVPYLEEIGLGVEDGRGDHRPL